jgi:hypothetical protein|tara:strand:+ start:546 stop:803 length:258 start_codon:yes stop_codon:yes gene_type:complete
MKMKHDASNDDDDRRRWAEEYPSSRRQRVTDAYRLAVVAIQTDDWLNDGQVRAAVKTAFDEYVEMREQYCCVRSESMWEEGDYKP